MIFVNLIKGLLLFIVLYFIYRILKVIFTINRNIKDYTRNETKNRRVNENMDDTGKVVELNKNQYKVE